MGWAGGSWRNTHTSANRLNPDSLAQSGTAGRRCALLKATPQRSIGVRVHSVTLVALLLVWALPLRASAADVAGLLRKASEHEKRRAWLEACRCYDEVLRKERNNGTARLGYQLCLRRMNIQAQPIKHFPPRIADHQRRKRLIVPKANIKIMIKTQD